MTLKRLDMHRAAWSLAPAEGVDCVIIGPHELDFHELVMRARSTRNASAYYEDLALNSVLLGGRRLQYMELLNKALTAARSRPHELSAFRQPSAAVCYLTSFLRRRGFHAEFVNFFNLEKQRLRELLDRVPRAVVLTSTFYVDVDPMVEIIRFVREHAPDTKIILGGPYVYRNCSNFDEATQEYLLRGIGADFYIFDSQGESTLAALLNALRRGDEAFTDVPNLIWTRDNETFSRTPRAVENNDIDENAVDWALLGPDHITPTAYMRTARSCPFACSFCCYPVAAGDHVLNSVETVVAQLEALRDMGVENVVFVDDTFNVPLPRFKALLELMIERRLGMRWMSFFRCSNADPKTFELMSAAGCSMAFLGIESADETILRNMEKFAKVERYRDGIRRLKDNGIHAHASLIVGFPGETERTVETTMDFLESTAPSSYAAQIFYHDPRAPLQKRAREFGLRGTGFAWSHATADWRDAVRWTRTMLEQIRGPALVGGYSFSCWSLFYLMTQNFSSEQLRAFLRLTRPMVLEGLDEREATGFEGLVSLFRTEPRQELATSVT